jgi:hypothetical protein
MSRREVIAAGADGIAAQPGGDLHLWQVVAMAGAPAPFSRGVDGLAGFIAQAGNACSPIEHQESGFPLGWWVLAQRRLHRSGKLPVIEAELLSAMPGWVWDWRENQRHAACSSTRVSATGGQLRT